MSAEEYYVFLGDHYFDPSQNRGEGPCALLYHPKHSQAEVLVQNYACKVSLQSNGKIAAVLFDFQGIGNTASLELLRALPVTFK